MVCVCARFIIQLVWARADEPALLAVLMITTWQINLQHTCAGMSANTFRNWPQKLFMHGLGWFHLFIHIFILSLYIKSRLSSLNLTKNWNNAFWWDLIGVMEVEQFLIWPLKVSLTELDHNRREYIELSTMALEWHLLELKHVIHKLSIIFISLPQIRKVFFVSVDYSFPATEDWMKMHNKIRARLFSKWILLNLLPLWWRISCHLVLSWRHHSVRSTADEHTLCFESNWVTLLLWWQR